MLHLINHLTKLKTFVKEQKPLFKYLEINIIKMFLMELIIEVEVEVENYSF